jgi:SH3-like domain-containing protein
MLAKPHDEAPLRARLAQGAIVDLIACEGAWVRVEAGRRRGFVKAAALWGAGCP